MDDDVTDGVVLVALVVVMLVVVELVAAVLLLVVECDELNVAVSAIALNSCSSSLRRRAHKPTFG